MTNSKYNDEQAFKCAIIAALHHEEVAKDLQQISELLFYEDQYYWNRLEFTLAIQKTDTFERKNLKLQ